MRASGHSNEKDRQGKTESVAADGSKRDLDGDTGSVASSRTGRSGRSGRSGFAGRSIHGTVATEPQPSPAAASGVTSATRGFFRGEGDRSSGAMGLAGGVIDDAASLGAWFATVWMPGMLAPLEPGGAFAAAQARGVAAERGCAAQLAASVPPGDETAAGRARGVARDVGRKAARAWLSRTTMLRGALHGVAAEQLQGMVKHSVIAGESARSALEGLLSAAGFVSGEA